MKEETKIILKFLKIIKDKNDFEKLKLRVKRLEEQTKPETLIEQELDREIREFLRD